MIYESVINISAGNSIAKYKNVVSCITSSESLINTHFDVDHNRAVFTFASHDFDLVKKGAKKLINSSFENIDIITHSGVHPQIGVVDVVPFVKYDESGSEIDYTNEVEFVNKVQDFAVNINKEYDLPIFFYDYASKQHNSLPSVRKHCFSLIKPDLGKLFPNPRLGSMSLGIRHPLIAINVNLHTQKLDTAKMIAKKIRESSGGHLGVRALGLSLPSQDMMQVSMNIFDIHKAKTDSICLEVRDLAEELNIKSDLELVGLIPKFHFETFSSEFIAWSNLNEESTIEFHL